MHTTTFAEILHGLGASLIVTTYQSGRVIILRAEDGKTLDTSTRTHGASGRANSSRACCAGSPVT